ncbi:TPA: hypothetical protein O4G11_003624 [Proteus mirabilis]|nr:hypothetical protein [Proteus mirabilis]
MNIQNGFNDLVFNIDGKEKQLSLKHLSNLSLEIKDFRLENNSLVDIVIHMRPTNHLYSRRFDPDNDDAEKLNQTGELLFRYEHHEGNFQSVKDGIISSEKRVFCEKKYEQSKMFPLFVRELSLHPSSICVLANPGDDRSCLSALWALPSPYSSDEKYIVIFKLNKVNSTTINMLVETAFVVKNDDFRVKKISDSKYRHGQKPFFVILKNILAGRKPFDSPKKKFKKGGKKSKT